MDSGQLSTIFFAVDVVELIEDLSDIFFKPEMQESTILYTATNTLYVCLRALSRKHLSQEVNAPLPLLPNLSLPVLPICFLRAETFRIYMMLRKRPSLAVSLTLPMQMTAYFSG